MSGLQSPSAPATSPDAAAPPQSALLDAALGRFARHMAHDVNNYLAAMLSRAELIGLDLPPDSPLQADVEELVASAEELRGYLRRLVSIASTTSPSREPGALDVRLAEVLAELLPARPVLRLSMHGGAPGVESVVSDNRWREILGPLLDNAQDAYRRLGCSEGELTVTTMPMADDGDPLGRPGVLITLTDAGSGIAPEIAPVMFEPLASTKRVRGAGLSLLLVRRLVHTEGGTLSIAACAPHGATVRLWVPVAD
jgi:signal transduction histidine kinase